MQDKWGSLDGSLVKDASENHETYIILPIYRGFPGSSAGKESACNAEHPNSIPGLGRSTGERNGYPFHYSLGFPGGSDGEESHAVWETWVRSWVGKIPWTRERLPTPVVWPGEFNGQRSLSGYSRWGRKESDMTEWLSLFTFPHLQVGTTNQLPFTSENFNIVTKRCGESTVSASTLYKLLCSNDLWAALLAVCKVSYWYVYHKLLGFPSDSLVKKCLPMQKTRVLFLGWEDPLEKEMAIHCSILAWEIPWTRRPGALQSMRSQHLTRLSGSTINMYYQWFTGFWSFFLLNFDGTKQLNGTPRINKRSDAPVNERK